MTFPDKIQIRAIAVGEKHSLFLAKGGSLFGTGANDQGQLGLGDKVSQTSTPSPLSNIIF